jgi:hypothetical protein
LAIETKWPRRRHEIADGRLLPARDFTHRNSVLPVRPVIAIGSFRKSICRGCQRKEQSRIAPVSFPHRPRDDRVDTGPNAKPIAPSDGDFGGIGGSGW